ncbi:MAG: hypothetical protein ACI9TV_001010 [Sulfurimonas sp.]|jgi:hypothetical protein|uniref:hypothetical protein n=1 Tax=Sulfurimonas sp. TaxID=2022749 RepID=UPI0039E2D93D
MSQVQNLFEVAPGTELIGEEITIFGDVHKDSLIDTHKLFVKGIIHSQTSQFTKYAQIQEHHGMLRCHEAHINTLHGGEVHASNLTIDTCLGGKIYVQDVTIKNVSGQVQIYASNSITIESVNDSNNSFNINYQEVPILLSKIELIEEDIQELVFLLEKAKVNNAPSQKDIEGEIQRLRKELTFIEESSKSARISITNAVEDGNFISFTIKGHTIAYTTQNNCYTPFHLECTNTIVKLLPTQTIITF